MLEQYWSVGAARADRTRCADGHSAAGRQPEGSRRRPDRQLPCRVSRSTTAPAIVVDFGSSICVDVVSAKGEFLGGAIAPGIQVSSDAAAARSAALRRVELTRPRSVVGKNTVECMQAGAVFGFAGLVDGLVEPDPRGRRRLRGRRRRGGGHRAHRAAAAAGSAHRRALRPAPDARRSAPGVRAQPGQQPRQAQQAR